MVPAPTRLGSLALSVIAALAAVLALRYARELLIPIFVAVFIGYALNPIVTRVAQLRIPRPFAAAVVLVGVLTASAGAAYNLRHQATAIVESLPEGAEKLREAFRSARNPAQSGTIGKIGDAATEIEKTADETIGARSAPRGVMRVQVEEPTFRAGTYLWSGSMGLMGFIGQATLVFFLSYFLLASGDLYRRKLVKVAGTLSEKKLTLEILKEIDSQIEWFLIIQMFTSAVVGITTGIALWSLGVAQPAVWGVFAGVLNSVPYFGPILVSGGLALVAFLQFGTLTMALLVAGIALLITTLEGFLLTPILMGRAARMNQVALFTSLLFWTWVWGVWGLLLAVPIMMAIKSICDRIEGLQPMAELLGE